MFKPGIIHGRQTLFAYTIKREPFMAPPNIDIHAHFFPESYLLLGL
jgi:hypothetical protein